MNVLEKIRNRAKTKKRRVVLPEGSEPRVLKAAAEIIEDEMAQVTIIGNPNSIKKQARELGLNIDAADIIEPEGSSDFDRYVEEFMEIRKAKNVTADMAKSAIASPLYFGAMLVRDNKADASVAGSINTTGDVLRAAIQVLGLQGGIDCVSSCFMMTIPSYRGEENKVFLYADGAVMPNPTSEQLASIAVSTAETMQNLLGIEPRVAMLSFSTKGSAKHKDVEKVKRAFEIVKENNPNLLVDGELQVDAAIVPEIAKSKAPGSVIGGNANVLIFPDLDAANIAYKLTERLANATATGPIIQGLAKPANDLSRGCSVQDIVDVTAIAILMKG